MGISSTVRAVVSRTSDENVTFFAASIAYYAFFSIVPMVLLVLSIGSLVGGEAFAQRLVGVIEGNLSSSGQQLLTQALGNRSGQVGASIVGIVGLLWSAIKVIRAIDVAFDEIYATDAETSLVGQVRDGIAVLGLVGLGIILMVGLGTFIRRPAIVGGIPYADLLGWLALLVGLVIVFLPLYYVMPPEEMNVSAALPGTLVAAVGWILLQVGFQLYSAYAANFEAYGIIGGVLLFLTWLYFASVLILLGAVVNAVVAQDVGRTSADRERGAPATD